MTAISRRRALKTLFCSSAALGLNLSSRRGVADEINSPTDQHFLVVGDIGSMDKSQTAVAAGMIRYAQTHSLKPHGLWLLGDNFYKEVKGGVDSPRWKTGFEDMYPAASFPGPCWAMLGNHDYVDSIDGDRFQLDYPKKNPSTRWKMPSKWYRVDWPAVNPVATFLVLDTNWKSINEPAHKSSIGKRPPWYLSDDEEKAQDAWLQTELAKPRTAPFLICAGHHPFYSNSVGDTKPLVEKWGPLFQKSNVHLYLCGHDHDLQHLELEGLKTSWGVSGAGGARLTEIKNKSRTVPFGKAVYGFSHLQIDAKRLLLRHIDANGGQLHAFTKTTDGKVTIL